MSATIYNQTGTTANAFVSMVMIHCCNCGVPFMMPEQLQDRFERDSNKWFYCPNGHRQHYSESTEEKLKKQLEKVKQEAEQKSQQLKATIERREQTIHQLNEDVKSERGKANYHKGKKKLLQARSAAGLCSCCNRTFSNMVEHMKTMHPEEVAKAKTNGQLPTKLKPKTRRK